MILLKFVYSNFYCVLINLIFFDFGHLIMGLIYLVVKLILIRFKIIQNSYFNNLSNLRIIVLKFHQNFIIHIAISIVYFQSFLLLIHLFIFKKKNIYLFHSKVDYSL